MPGFDPAWNGRHVDHALFLVLKIFSVRHQQGVGVQPQGRIFDMRVRTWIQHDHLCTAIQCAGQAPPHRAPVLPCRHVAAEHVGVYDPAVRVRKLIAEIIKVCACKKIE